MIVRSFNDGVSVQTYIVRIYRCEKDNPHGLLGVVEEAGKAARKAFTDYDELWQILNFRGKGSYGGTSDPAQE